MPNTATMPKKEEKTTQAEAIQMHKKAAKHHEEAAKHHNDAAKHHEDGNHDKAAASTVKANGESFLATTAQREDAQYHAINK